MVDAPIDDRDVRSEDEIINKYLELSRDRASALSHFQLQIPIYHSIPTISFANGNWVNRIKGFRDECVKRGISRWIKPERDDATRVDGSEVLFVVGRKDKTPFAMAMRIFCQALATTSPVLKEAALLGGLVTKEVGIMRYTPTSNPHADGVSLHSDATRARKRIASLLMCISPPTGTRIAFFPLLYHFLSIFFDLHPMNDWRRDRLPERSRRRFDYSLHRFRSCYRIF